MFVVQSQTITLTTGWRHTVAGISRAVIESRNALILSQIEAHAPNKERYTLVAKVVNVGIALLLYARDEEIASRVRDVQTQWTGCGPLWMGNKGAVGIRLDLHDTSFCFLTAHLAAGHSNTEERNHDYHTICSGLQFLKGKTIESHE